MIKDYDKFYIFIYNIKKQQHKNMQTYVFTC